MVHQVRLGRQGWLDSNYRDLQDFQRKHRDLVSMKPSENKESFTILISGQGRYKNHSLKVQCRHPLPGQPPKFELLNAEEIGRLDHPHIKEVYWCLKFPWVPKTPLSFPLNAICQTWWRPSV